MIGIVLSLSLLWTIAISVPDSGVTSNGGADSTSMGLVINGTHYIIFDANIGLYEDPNGGQVHNVAYATPIDSRVSSFQNPGSSLTLAWIHLDLSHTSEPDLHAETQSCV